MVSHYGVHLVFYKMAMSLLISLLKSKQLFIRIGSVAVARGFKFGLMYWPHTGHMWDKPSSACGCARWFFLKFSNFRPPTDWPVSYELK